MKIFAKSVTPRRLTLRGVKQIFDFRKSLFTGNLGWYFETFRTFFENPKLANTARSRQLNFFKDPKVTNTLDFQSVTFRMTKLSLPCLSENFTLHLCVSIFGGIFLLSFPRLFRLFSDIKGVQYRTFLCYPVCIYNVDTMLLLLLLLLLLCTADKVRAGLPDSVRQQVRLRAQDQVSHHASRWVQIWQTVCHKARAKVHQSAAPRLQTGDHHQK